MNQHPPIDLRNVTLCAADCINPALALRALEISAAQCDFADKILFTHEAPPFLPPELPPSFPRTVLIPRLQSLEDYSRFMLKDLVHHISTPWVLVIQWDGYVVDPTAWSDAFFDYDYIGSLTGFRPPGPEVLQGQDYRWPQDQNGMSMGNGGFSLRSKKLLQALADPRVRQLPDIMGEDELTCQTYRPWLEAEYGIRFAPAHIANRFSYEKQLPERPTFGFHSPVHLWRHVDDETMPHLICAIDDQTYYNATNVMRLLINYCVLRKFACIKAMYGRYRREWSAPQVRQAMVRMGISDAEALQYVEFCEGVMQ